MPKKEEVDDLNYINVFGARENNLKNINISIPRNKLVVITGISGSGKSSLAFNTIYAEGQRRYMESFSAFARQFIGSMERPDVDKITGLSPVISIEQKTTNKNPRSTVGTVTEIYDFLRLLFARLGEAYSFNTGKKMEKFTSEQIVNRILKDLKGQKIAILAPLIRGRKGHYRELFEQLRKKGYLRVRADGEIIELKPKLMLDRFKIHDIEAIIDRVIVKKEDKVRLGNAVSKALEEGNGLMFILNLDNNKTQTFSKLLMDAETGIAYEEPSPNSFSFNSPYGYCQNCKGLGFVKSINLEAIIPDDTSTINLKGIVPLGEVRDNYTFKNVKKIAKKYKFTFDTPIKKIPEKGLNILLFGDEKDLSIDYELGNEGGLDYYDWNGIIPFIIKCFNASSSDGIRRWAEEFMLKETCKSCDGSRLRKESLHFKIAELIYPWIGSPRP